MESETLELQRKLNKEIWDNVALRIRIQGTEDACKVLRGCVERRDKENAELHERLNRENESANKHFMDSKKKDAEIAELQAALVNAGKEIEHWKKSVVRGEILVSNRDEMITSQQNKLCELHQRLNDENERANAATKEVKELKDKLSISDFWKNAASNLREELSRAEATVTTLQKKYDNAVAIGLGYMNQCEKAQSEVEGLKYAKSAYATANGNLLNEINRLKEIIRQWAEKNTDLSARNSVLADDLALAKARLEYSSGLVDKMGKEKQYLLDQLTDDEKKIAGLQEQVGRYAAECSKLNAELVKARQAASPWVITCGSFST